jgi:erythromycin esterase-like protein
MFMTHGFLRLALGLAALWMTAIACSADESDTTPTVAVDHHLHISSPALASRLRQLCDAAPGAKCPRDLFNSVSAQAASEALTSAGIARGVLISQAYLLGSEQLAVDGIDGPATAAAVRAENAYVQHEAAGHREQFVAFLGINPLAKSALEEIDYWAKEGGFAGIKLHLTNAHFDFRSPEQVGKLAAVFDAAARHGFAIIIHARTRVPDYGAHDMDVFLKEVLPHARGTVVQLAHAAGWSGIDAPTLAALDTLAGAFRTNPQLTSNLYFDLSRVSGGSVQPQHESGGQASPQDAQRLAQLIRAIGPAHFLMGSDWSIPSHDIAAMNREVFASIPLTSAEWRQIAAASAPYFSTGAKQIQAVASIDPQSADFDDLQPIATEVGDARIVMLGEQTHGGGNAFLAKTRVLRYLHERLGFEVLAFESGMWEMERAQQLIASGQKPSTVLPQAVYPIWMQSNQVQPLLQYLDQDAHSRRPLQLTGFDMQLSGPGELTRELPLELAKLNSQLAGDRAGLDRIEALVAGLIADGYQAMPKFAGLETLDVARLHADTQATLARIDRAQVARAAFWRQYLQSIEQLLVFFKRIHAKQNGIFNMRDRQMAANLAWLLDVGYAGKKVVVWAATAHVINSREAIDKEGAAEMVPMGTYVHRKLGERSYVIAFSAGQGATRNFKTRQVTQHGPAPAQSIEWQIAQSGSPYAFVGRRAMQEQFGGKRVSWLLGFEPMTGAWPDVVDGIFYFSTEQPSTYITPAEAE